MPTSRPIVGEYPAMGSIRNGDGCVIVEIIGVTYRLESPARRDPR
jgi:hypothetical protein